MFTHKRALPFHEQSTLFLSWMTMLMVFIASLTLFGSLSLTNIIQTWNRAVAGSLTIQVPTYDVSGMPRSEAVQADVDGVLAVLQTTAGVAGADVLTDDDMATLMEPWLGVLDKVEELPIPKLIDVRLKKDQAFDFAAFQQTLSETVPAAQVDSHRMWLTHLIDMARGIQNMIVFILGLLILTTSFTVIWTTLSSLAVQGPVLKLLHMMGARDTAIALQYASRSFIKAFMGGCVGFILALPIVWVVASMINPLQEPILAAGSFHAMQWVTVLSVPFLAAVLSFVTALMTVLKKLKAVV